jgi:cytochrome c oxidase cbb3-type subunit 3
MVLSAAAVTGCEPEKRALAPTAPLTDPSGPADERASIFEDSFWQVSEGSLYFTWYGCGACHGESAKGVLDLGDDRWLYGGSMADVFASIANGRPAGMPAYRSRMPQEQLWQVSAYVRQLHKTKPAARRRQDLDQQGQPQAATWTGAVR